MEDLIFKRLLLSPLIKFGQSMFKIIYVGCLFYSPIFYVRFFLYKCVLAAPPKYIILGRLMNEKDLSIDRLLRTSYPSPFCRKLFWHKYEQEVRRLLVQFPDKWYLSCQRLVYCLLQLDRTFQAKIFTEVQNIDDADEILQYARNYSSSRNTSNAIIFYERALYKAKNRNQQLKVIYQYCFMLIKRQQFTLARSLLQKKTGQTDFNPEQKPQHNRILIQIFWRMGQYSKLWLTLKAEINKPKCQSTLMNDVCLAVRMKLLMGDLRSAEKMVDILNKRWPDSPRTSYLESVYCFKNKNWGKFSKKMKKAVQKTPSGQRVDIILHDAVLLMQAATENANYLSLAIYCLQNFRAYLAPSCTTLLELERKLGAGNETTIFKIRESLGEISEKAINHLEHQQQGRTLLRGSILRDLALTIQSYILGNRMLRSRLLSRMKSIVKELDLYEISLQLFDSETEASSNCHSSRSLTIEEEEL